MSLQGTKPKAQSLTIWGAVVAVVAGILSGYGYTISVDDQAALVDLISMVVAFVAGVMAFVGRIRATKTVK